jgi:FkbM family methyltransferase
MGFRAGFMAVHPSQHEEEKAVQGFFGGKRTGVFVEVGANQATNLSQTWHLEQLGWTGVLVEPQRDLAAALVAQRSAKVFAVACSSPENSGRSMSLYVDGPCSALNRDRMAPGAKPACVISVPVRTLDSVLDEANAVAPLDLLSVDVEGHEVEVFSGFDFRRWQPSLILAEDHVSNLRTHHVLTANGYRLIRRLGNNGWYVPANVTVPVSLPERWEIVRKYYLALPFRILRNMFRHQRAA